MITCWKYFGFIELDKIYYEINFTFFLLFKMWLFDNLKLHMWVTFVAHIIFLLVGAALEFFILWVLAEAEGVWSRAVAVSGHEMSSLLIREGLAFG